MRDQAVAGLFQDLPAVPGSEAALEDLYALAAAYRRWAAIDRAVVGHILAGGATLIAVSSWVALHELVTLELAGSLDGPAADTAFRSTTDAVLRGWATPSAFPCLRRADPAV